eukprot:1144654-Pelagomonas_calceolata.AAC.3
MCCTCLSPCKQPKTLASGLTYTNKTAHINICSQHHAERSAVATQQSTVEPYCCTEPAMSTFPPAAASLVQP